MSLKKVDNMRLENSVDVDRVWIALDKWGWYQKKQTLVTLLSIWSFGLHMLSIVFIGYRPSYECKEDDNFTAYQNSSEVWKEYDKCSVRTYTNITGHMTVVETSCTNGWTFFDPEPFNKERSLLSEWELVCSRDHLAEISQTLLMVGQGLGAAVATPLADRFGRKPVHVGCHVLLFVFSLATVFVPDYTSFVVLRVLLGITQQGTALTAAILNLERFPTEIRFVMEVLALLCWTTGMSLITPMAYLTRNLSWRYLQGLATVVSSWSLIHWWLIDESLRWLVANGRVDEARTILQKACRTNGKDYDTVAAYSRFDKWEQKQNTSEMRSSSTDICDNTPATIDHSITIRKYGIQDLIKSKRIFLTTLILWFAWTSNSLTYYGIMMISSSLVGNRFLSFFLGAVVEYMAVVVEWLMLNRCGRKFSVVLFNCLCGVSLIAATILITLADGNRAMLLSSTALTLFGKFTATASFSTFFLYTPELYPTNLRNLGIGLSSAAARIGGMIAPFFRNLAVEALWAPGLICGIMCVLVSIAMLWVPETNRYELPQTIEECEAWYKDNQFTLPIMRSKKRKSERSPQSALSS